MILVTGASGFVGHYLTAALGSQGRALVSDLRDQAAVRSEIADLGPITSVVHLAALSNVKAAFEHPWDCHQVNFGGTFTLLEALKSNGFSGRFLYVSSGDVYGRVLDADLPIAEGRMPRPRNPYAASKLAAEAVCLEAAAFGQFEVVILRPFNHLGPGQSTDFAVPYFASQLARIKRGDVDGQLSVGNIDVTRDFTDVTDVVRAYLAVLDCSSSLNGQILNVCSGVERKIADVIGQLAALLDVEVELQVDPARQRKNEQARVVGDCSVIHELTGWSAITPFEKTLDSIATYWQEQEKL